MEAKQAVLWWLPTLAVIAVAVVAVFAAERRRLLPVLAVGALAIAVAGWQQYRSQAQRRAEHAEMRELSDRIDALAQAAAPASGTSENVDSAAAAAAAGAEVATLQRRVKGLEDQIANLRERYSNRTIDPSKAAAIADALRPLAGTVAVVSCAPGDVEAYSYASRLATLLRNAGWDARGPETTQIFGNAPAVPVGVYVPEGRPGDPAKAVIEALSKAGVPAQPGIAPTEGIPNPVAVELYVPKKP